MDPDVARFRDCLLRFISGPPAGISEANRELQSLQVTNWPLFLMLAARVGESPGNQPRLVYIALSAVKSAVTPRHLRPISRLRADWLAMPNSDGIRELIRHFVFTALSAGDGPTQNLAAATLARVRVLEESRWDSLFCALFSEGNSLPPPIIINVFKEILDLPLKLSDAAAGPISRLLAVLYSEIAARTTPLFGKFKCAQCLRLLLRRVRSLFQEDAAFGELFEVIEATLPTADLPLYRELHFVLIELLKLHYANPDKVIEKVFRITAVGLDCAEPCFRAISIHFWAVLWRFEVEQHAKATALAFQK
jgi:hypothetical protein